MTKKDDQKLAALVKKNLAKQKTVPQAKARRQYDATLPPEKDDDTEKRDFFSEMKKRSF